MGLDMYLNEEMYLGMWDHMKDEPEYELAKKVIDLTGLEPDSRSPHITVEVCRIYWRKANQIHNWFMNNTRVLQQDVSSEVSRKDLATLAHTCRDVLEDANLVDAKVVNGQILVEGEWQDVLENGKVLMNPQKAIDLLPTMSGFFFGSTEYDQWYIEDLERTVERIHAVLEEPKSEWFTYKASW